MDNTTTIQDLKTAVEEFVAARDWQQFHSPKNLAMALAIEAAELMEHFQWLSLNDAWEALENEKVRGEVADELADIVVYALAFANRNNIDISTTVRDKMVKNGRKYPAEKFKGRF